MYQLYKCDSHMLLLSRDIDLELHILMLKNIITKVHEQGLKLFDIMKHY